MVQQVETFNEVGARVFEQGRGLEFWQQHAGTLHNLRDKYGVYAESGENRIHLPLVLEVEGVPDMSQYRDQLHAAQNLNELIVQKLVPAVMRDPAKRESMVRPYISENAYNYLLAYSNRHGFDEDSPVISRVDMLMTKEGPKALEINCDKPEGCGMTWGEVQTRRAFFNNELDGYTPLSDFFFASQESYVEKEINRLISSGSIKDATEANIVIPYWKDGAVERFDSNLMAQQLEQKGYKVNVVPVEDLQAGNPDGYNIVLSDVEFATERWDNLYAQGAAFFHDEAWRSLKHFTSPIGEVGGYKHFIALVYKLANDPALAQEYGFNDDDMKKLFEIQRSGILLESYSPRHNDVDSMRLLYESDPDAWVFKLDFSSHGDGFNEHVEPDGFEAFMNDGRYLMQRKAEGLRTGRALVLDRFGKVVQKEGMLMDICPMGEIKGKGYAAIMRMCDVHPMNLLKELRNGEDERSGFLTPLILVK